jgi:Domain of unknown function (DUF4942)
MMSAIALRDDLLREPSELFSEGPDTGRLHMLFTEYAERRAGMEAFSAYTTNPRFEEIVRYYGHNIEHTSARAAVHFVSTRLFAFEPAVKYLDADYWQRALSLLGLLEIMPAKRAQEWREQLAKAEVPPFTLENVRATLGDLIAARPDFLVERVEGLYYGLSGEHKTNSPKGFGTRMILRWVTDGFSLSQRTLGLLEDLRRLVQVFRGEREVEAYRLTYALLSAANSRTGEWFEAEGGAYRLRVYKKGTGHIEVHPDVAWRLNAILAHKYPRAIPAAERTKPKARPRTYAVMEQPLPVEVRELFQRGLEGWRRSDSDRTLNTWRCFLHDTPKAAREEFEAILHYLGAVREPHGEAWTFPYSPWEVIESIALRGSIPHGKSHQFYPTPATLAERVRELADITSEDYVLEPSAGMGALVEGLDPRQVLCIEIAPVHAEVLRARGFEVLCQDFLEYQPTAGTNPDRIVMNPPFNEGRWRAHVEHALSVLRPGGVLVSILPSGAASSLRLEAGFSATWTEPIAGAFRDASVSVVILRVERKP